MDCQNCPNCGNPINHYQAEDDQCGRCHCTLSTALQTPRNVPLLQKPVTPDGQQKEFEAARQEVIKQFTKLLELVRLSEFRISNGDERPEDHDAIVTHLVEMGFDQKDAQLIEDASILSGVQKGYRE